MTGLFAYSMIFGLTFVAVGGAALLVWTFLDRDDPVTPGDAGILEHQRLSALSLLADLLDKLRFIAPLKTLLAEANVAWTVGRTLLTMLVAATVTLAILVRLDFVPTWAALLLAACAGFTPIFWLRRARTKFLRNIEEQLPEALDFISRALVAGHSLPMALELLADEIGAPLATELHKTVDEYNVGASMEQALENFAERVPSVDIQFFASAIMTQSRTGGSLHELLDNLADTIRERGVLKGQVRALTANGRMTAIVLSSLPVFIAGMMMLINPAYFNLLLDHPVGKPLVFIAVCSQVAAFFVINKIVDVKV